MKRFFVLSLFLFSVSVFGQSTIDFETVGQDFVWTVMANNPDLPTDYSVVSNPDMTGINTSSHCAKYIVNTTGSPWSGIWTESMGSFTITADNSMPSVMVYKAVISDFALKLEGPILGHEIKVPNTVINQWEKLTFDFTADIGKTVVRLVVMPDFSDPRTAGSTNYFDNIQFVEPVIPVELSSFIASFVGSKVQLNWITATETNNRGFEIQRGVNKSEFTTIGFVKGSGTTTEKQSYSYLDNTELAGSIYYRLKQLDFGGSYSFSNTVEVTKVISYELSQNYPNPFNPTTTITYSIPQNSFVTLKVYNILGSEVAELVNGQVDAGVHKVNFNGFNLNSGVYFYTIKAGNFSETKKLMLMK